ncbi:TonB-dependent receptor [Hymenobacter daecheongensis DSM 21074]|uniref:TonB-dependent receptor n=1 Tax=Hymenobacter daecheongensis DSM 21074 TaxID=1121955 RepID=A0A1M6LDT8_9BACT|nr:TonB-dependent receptor [Hymenobacter daecheongensis]SHJ69328.1 TonB-dependent receptor [Hymenobacter daecheongensis DSM 21074]
MRRSALLFFLLTLSHLLLAQQGSIGGKVTDKKTGEGVIGATVLVTGTTQAAPVDVEGNYDLKLDPGTYSITMTYIGYKPLNFNGIVVRAEAKTTLNGVMEENAQNLKEVVVTGQKQTGTEVALIQDLKRSEVVVSGISNDQIVKSLDRDAAEVVKRIPGVTVQSNNFIVIRGLAERYNTVLLNDALTPSAEVDTRSFSFDILPSSVIDRVLIFKSGSPELPGEMGGGVVKVYTKNSVLDNSTTLSLSSWARHGTTFNNFLSSNRSKTDWLGYDNGPRQLPTSGSVEEIGTRLPNSWEPRTVRSRPDMRLSLGLNRKFEIGSKYLSNVTSLSYSNTQERYNIVRQRIDLYQEETQARSVRYDYNDDRSLAATRLGIIHNWQLRLNNRNRLEFRNFFNQYGTDEVVYRTGVLNTQEQERDEYATHYQSRSIYSGQLQGTHEVGKQEHTTLSWAGGYNYVFRDEPDYRRYQNQRIAGTTDPFRVNIVASPNQFDASRFYSNLKEDTYMASGQWERRWAGRDTLSANKYKLRIGFYTEQKDRTLANRYFSYVSDANTDPSLLNSTLTVGQLFSAANIGPRGFKLAEATLPQDRYEAANTLVAGYVGAVAPISDKFNVSGGVRVEYNRKTLLNGDGINYKEIRTIPMPSFNAAYNFNERSLLRLGGSVTVNRPEFREVANYVFYDFSANTGVQGNDSLKTATIYNGDLRYEFYPTRSEVISVGVFYKHFRDAIEQTILPLGSESINVSYANAPTAYDYGVEVEVRKSLAQASQNAFLQRLNFVMNASYIKSEVNLRDDERQILKRPLQGQSPYVFNVGTFYQDDERHWQVSAQYNVVGPRILLVGDRSNNFSVIERPRNIIDLSVTKGLGQHLEIKAGIQDLLNQPVRQSWDLNRDNKITDGTPEADTHFGRYRRGSYSTLGLTYRF